jgi:copper(I)-binding protein
MRLILGSALLLLQIARANAAGHLLVESAWIRTAPPGAMMLAGYATLRNAGDAPVRITGAKSEDFGAVSLHESVEENGVERMRALGELTIAPGASVKFAPGGKHFMLMRPKHELKAGEAVRIDIATDAGPATSAGFTVRETAP